jgi:hypothetical protein
MRRFTGILTHPGSAHKDEFLACCLLAAVHEAPIFRREPTQADLDNPALAVVDVGGEDDAVRGNFDHHQFPKDHPPICSLSLVLMDLGLYEDARLYCDWLEVAEWFDTRGPVETAAWLGVERELLAKLNSTVDLTLLRRFAGMSEIRAGEPMWEVMRWVGGDLIGYLRSLREKLNDIARLSEIWEIPHEAGDFRVLFLPRSESFSEDASAGLARYHRDGLSGPARGGLRSFPVQRRPAHGFHTHRRRGRCPLRSCPRLRREEQRERSRAHS